MVNNNRVFDTPVSELLKSNDLVSIVVPMYNAEKCLKDTIESVKSQTYDNWELILVDDCSIDNSYNYAKQFANDDDRIKVFKMDVNSGPGAATKYACQKAKGSLIAFIDADDIWLPNKLDVQIKYMKNNGYEFVCSDYEQIDEKGLPIGKIIHCKERASFKTILMLNTIGSSSAIVTRRLINLIDIPEVRKCNDYSLWLEILKIYPFAYGIDDVLMKYRVWPQSISYNKVKKLKPQWYAMRKYGELNVLESLFMLAWWIFIKVVGIK